jgi:putative transport protein
MSSIAIITLAVSLGAVLGILLGQVKYRGVGLGIGGVLFAGIIVGHFAHAYLGFDVRDETGAFTTVGSILHYVQEFGLILFVYAIGIKVGPSFFSSLRGQGVKLIGWAVTIIVMGCAIAMAMFFCGIVPVDAMIGMYTGAITNTPALGAGTQMISDMAAAFGQNGGSVPEGFNSAVVPSAYAMAYPFAVVSLLLVMIVLKIIFSVSIDKAGEDYAAAKSKGVAKLAFRNVLLTEAASGKTVNDIPGVASGAVVCSRYKHAGELSVPHESDPLAKGDIVHLVGLEEDLRKAVAAIGEITNDAMTTHGSRMTVRHIMVTDAHSCGVKLGSLNLHSRFNISVSRVFRAGIQMLPHDDFVLQYGDEINVIGTSEDIKRAGSVIGNSSASYNRVTMLPVFIGIFLGILLGSIPIPVPGVPAPMKLGLAGGPLVAAIFLARFGDVWTRNLLHWRLPAPAVSTFNSLGITLFLTIVGITAGASGFWETLTEGPGLKWMAWATLISFIPIMVVGFLAIKVSKINYLVTCGMIAGSYTDPPALAYANGMYRDAEASSIGYATVYPFVMFLRILSPQIMVIIAAAFV